MLGTDGSGVERTTSAKDFLTKNHQGGLKLKRKKVAENDGALSQLSSLALRASQVASS